MKVELLGGCSKNELEERIKRVATAGKLSRFPGNIFEVLESCNNYETNLKLIKRIIKMGHKSIIEHDYLVLALCDVSPIVEQTIIGNRLTSFTIKSRREVDFRKVGFYVPEFRDKNYLKLDNNKELQKEYKDYMQSLFDSYGKFVDLGINVEDARFILPYCYHSNIIMGLDARELEKLTISLLYGNLSKISELNELGKNFYSIIEKYIPYLIDSIENSKIQSDSPFMYLESIAKRPINKIIDKTILLNYTPNPDDSVLETSIAYHFQISRKEAKEILCELEKQDINVREKLMDIIMKKSENRELEHAIFQFQIPISLSILTHLTRHRMHSLLVPEFVPMWDLNNYKIPEAFRTKLLEEYKNIFKNNKEKQEYFKRKGVVEEDLIYFYLGGNMCNVITTMNARNVQWITKLRACNKAQWEINLIAKDIVKEVKKVAPLIGKNIGSSCAVEGVCYEGKECCGKIKNIIIK